MARCIKQRMIREINMLLKETDDIELIHLVLLLLLKSSQKGGDIDV